MKKPKKRGYGYNADRAINALIATSQSLVGDTLQARELIMALCDQAGVSRDAQCAIKTLITPMAICPNCSSSTHDRCCSQCGKTHKPARLHYEHCSAKCDRDAARADQISAAMEESAIASCRFGLEESP